MTLNVVVGMAPVSMMMPVIGVIMSIIMMIIVMVIVLGRSGAAASYDSFGDRRNWASF